MSHLKLELKANRNKSKNKQMGPNKTFKLLYSKRIHKQYEDPSYRLGENICKCCDRQRPNFQDILAAYITQ